MNADIQRHIKQIKESCFKIEVQVLEDGKLPTKKHLSDAGFDLYATSDITLYPGMVIKHPLNIRFKLPVGTWAEITTKSSLGAKGQLVYAGVIDESYRGVPHVIMTNVCHKNEAGFNNLEPIVIQKGQKLAQLIMHSYNNQFYMEQVEEVSTDTARGEGGFGSTGK